MADELGKTDVREPFSDRKLEYVPGLAFILLDVDDPRKPLLRIALDPGYQGDLNDVLEKPSDPGAVYLECDHISAAVNSRLLRFLEVLKHHEYSGDDVPDRDAIIGAIDKALYQSSEEPKPFCRPDSGWYTWLVMKLMPPAPDRQIVMGFERLQPRMRWRHHLTGLVTVAVFFGVVVLQGHFVPWLYYSPLSGPLALAQSLEVPLWLSLPILVALVALGLKFDKKPKVPMSHSILTDGFFSRAAAYEEQLFREGSEDWTFWQRARSCAAFGLLHQSNLFYPFATILPLSMLGAVLMVIYLRTYRQTGSRRAAVLKASVWHRVYNRVVFCVGIVMIVVLLVWGVLLLF